jgi:hypothetical protein
MLRIVEAFGYVLYLAVRALNFILRKLGLKEI